MWQILSKYAFFCLRIRYRAYNRAYRLLSTLGADCSCRVPTRLPSVSGKKTANSSVSPPKTFGNCEARSRSSPVNERSWQSLVKHLGYSSPNHYTMALTDRRARITYVRADAILHPTSDRRRSLSISSRTSWRMYSFTAETRTGSTIWLSGG